MQLIRTLIGARKPRRNQRHIPTARRHEQQPIPKKIGYKKRRKTWARLLKQVYEVAPLLCECGSKFEVISVIEARHHSNVVGKIPASIKFVFEVLKLQEDGAGSDAYCF